MPRIKYEEKRFRSGTLELIKTANEIIAEYSAQGYDLTLRQLYYQFVARDLIPNTNKSYRRIGSALSDARLAGLVDWQSIVDRTRSLRSLPSWEDPAHIVEACASQFRVDKWVGQKTRVEVWIEKDALIGVLSGVCNELDVGYFSCRGYTSQSSLWRAARRLIGYENRGQATVIFHLGDHDPSGIDMTRDIRDRLRMFGSKAKVVRLALNMDQVEENQPPPNPTKLSDSRASEYVSIFGTESWELDALDPSTISDLIRTAVCDVRDDAMWEASCSRERSAKRTLRDVSQNWSDVVLFVDSLDYGD